MGIKMFIKGVQHFDTFGKYRYPYVDGAYKEKLFPKSSRCAKIAYGKFYRENLFCAGHHYVRFLRLLKCLVTKREYV